MLSPYSDFSCQFILDTDASDVEFGTVLSQVDNEGNYVPIGAVQQRGGTVSHDLSYCLYLCSVAPIQWAEIFHGSLELWNYVHVYILMHKCANII